MNSIARVNPNLTVLETALQNAADNEDPTEGLNELLQFCYEALSSSQVAANCYWHGREMFHDCSAFHFSEVIAHWILEGYLGQVESIEKAYAEGHRVLIELIDRGLMKIIDDDLISMERLSLALPDNRERGFYGESNLGLAHASEDGKSEGFGRIVRTEGMVKILSEQKNAEPITLMLDGSQDTEELARSLNEEVQGIALFNPRFQLALESLHAQKLLVLRGSDWLESITELRNFKSLTVLEISGASSLEKIPDDLFKEMVDIRSLNLSGTGIKTLPSSFSNLSKLQWLVLCNCYRLEMLPSLKGCKDLEVLNLSGANSLRRIHDLNFALLKKLQFLDLSDAPVDRLPFINGAKSLTRLFLRGCSKLFRMPNLPESLQILELSNASSLMEIFQLPLNENDLRVLNMNGCSNIEKLPSTKSFEKLEFLDLSGAVSLAEFEDESFEHLSSLKVLNLSETKVEKLPLLGGLGNLQKLLLRSCRSLSSLPNMEGLSGLEELDLSDNSSLRELKHEHLNHKNLKNLLLARCVGLTEIPSLEDLEKLEVFDLSGCTFLSAIPDSSFKQMSQLQWLNLSSTNILELPSLVNLGNLRHLLLGNCADLKSLTGLESLSMLQEINLCGARSLSDNGWSKSLKNMTSLEKLDLSGTQINQLPSFVSLTQLVLSGCSDLVEWPNLEELKHLKVLNLAQTAIKSPPSSLESLVELQELILTNCSGLKQLQSLASLVRLEILDIWGTSIKEFPYWTQELNLLKQLYLPDLSSTKVDWSRIRWLPEALNWDESGILKISRQDTLKPVSVAISGTMFFNFLEKHPDLWETTFKRFHFSVFPPGVKNWDMYRWRDQLEFQDIYLELRNLPPQIEINCMLEVHGLENFLEDLKCILRRTEYLLFSDISCLSSLPVLDVNVMKGCWLENCKNIQNIFNGGKDDLPLGQNLEAIWVSNLPKLSCLYSENTPFANYQNLRKLHIDCCPRLERVFSSSQNPENLQVLRISFCERLVTVFENDPPDEDRKLENLELFLFELPMLERTGVMTRRQPEWSEWPSLELGICSPD